MTRSDDTDELGPLLHDAVSDVEPGEGLDAIRARTGRSARRPRPWLWATGGAGLAVAATVAAVAVLGGSTGPATPDPAGSAPAASTPADPSPADPSPADPSPSGPEQTTATERPASGALPVYLVGDTGAGPRLFREFHPDAGGDFRLDVAVEQSLTGTSDDRDYGSLWPEGTTHQHAELSHGTLVVDLSGPVVQRPAGMTAAEAELALQQLVYTAQAVVQRTTPVTFLVDGQRTATLLGVPTDRPVPRAPADEVLASVSIGSPAEGATVTSPFTVTGQAATFEANVQWELKQGDTVVRRGFTTAEECCTLAPYSFSVDAPAGTYTLVVHDEDPSGGEGNPPSQDTKEIRVE
jgi:hypothetical protein